MLKSKHQTVVDPANNVQGVPPKPESESQVIDEFVYIFLTAKNIRVRVEYSPIIINIAIKVS